MNTKKQSVITYAVLIICSFVFISLCFNNNVWLDEAFTATLVHTDFYDVIRRSMADTLPPLYNILLKLATDIFGYTIPVMKITSVLPMVATLILGAVTVRKRFGFFTSLIFMVCITGMPLMLHYGIEIRMYSLGFFFATAAGVYAYEIVCDFNKKNCIMFAVFSALAGYSHHFAFVAVGFVYLFLLIYYFFAARESLRNWFISLAITVVLYLPCLVVTLNQLKSVSGYFTMPEITLSLFVQYAIYPFTTGNTAVSILLLLMILLLIGYTVLKIYGDKESRKECIYALTCFMVYYGVLIFGTLISKVMTANIFVDRYLFFSTGLIWLFASVMLSGVIFKEECRFKKAIRYAGIAACVLIAAVFGVTYCAQFGEEYDNDASYEIAFMEQNFTNDDIFCTIERHEEFQFIIPFYSILSGAPDIKYEAILSEALLEHADAANGAMWLIVQDGYEISSEDLKEINAAGYTPSYVASFEFDRYLCDVYQIM